MPFVNSTLFSFLFTMFLVYHDLKQNKIRCIDAPKYAFKHRNLPETEKYMWIIQVSIRLYNWVSCNQTLGCLRLYGDSRVSRAQPRIIAAAWLAVYFFLDKIGSQKRIGTYNFHIIWPTAFWRPVIMCNTEAKDKITNHTRQHLDSE